LIDTCLYSQADAGASCQPHNLPVWPWVQGKPAENRCNPNRSDQWWLVVSMTCHSVSLLSVLYRWTSRPSDSHHKMSNASFVQYTPSPTTPTTSKQSETQRTGPQKLQRRNINCIQAKCTLGTHAGLFLALSNR
jgi:hypothetical protein